VAARRQAAWWGGDIGPQLAGFVFLRRRGPSSHCPHACRPHPARPQVTLRCLFYPYLIWAFFREWRLETAACGTPWNPILLTPLMQSFLTGLNFHWTWQLLSKVLFPARSGKGGKGSSGKKGM
jgi:hypothetical protein